MSGRKVRDREEAHHLLRRWRATDLSMTEFCDKQDINVQSLAAHRRFINREAVQPAEQSDFVEVQVAPPIARHDLIVPCGSPERPGTDGLGPILGRSSAAAAPGPDGVLTLPPTVKIYVAKDPVSMRKSFNGLSGVVRERLEQDPTSGHLFCFFNRRQTLMKVLFCDDTGYSIFYKRLARGTYQLPDFTQEQSTVTVSPTTLAMIFEGIDLSSVKQRHRYRRSLDVLPEIL